MEWAPPRPEREWALINESEIVITERRAPSFGRTSHEATLACPHGSSSYTVFGEPSERREKAEAMVPAHRSRHRCRCQVAEQPVPAAAAGEEGTE